MFKNARKLLSAILSLTLAAGVVCALPASAENAEINPQEHLRLISSCSNFAAAVCTDKTPDGKGFKVSVANKNYRKFTLVHKGFSGKRRFYNMVRSR